MHNLTAQMMRNTQKIVKPYGIIQEKHWDYIFADYINQNADIGYHSSTISRVMSGMTLLPWVMVRHYAGYGTRCPATLVSNLRAYIDAHYWDKQRREALWMVIMDVLVVLPPKDQEDIREYWDSGDLAHMWAVLLWYCICSDYAGQTWAA